MCALACGAGDVRDACNELLDGADVGGITSATIVQGDKAAVQKRRDGCRARRSSQAIMAALDAAAESNKFRQAVHASVLAADAKAVRKREGLVAKSLSKIASDERLCVMVCSGLAKNDKVMLAA